MKKLALTFFLTCLLVVALTGCGENGMKDPRDGKTYKTVKIGDQTWMAENLNYKTEYSHCYKDEEANCAKYGRLYVWFEAIEVCPAGWHLPSKDDFIVLNRTVGEVQVNGKKRVLHDAGKRLKSTSGWKKKGNGDDTFSFSVLPAGGMWHHKDSLVNDIDDGRFFSDKGSHAYIWLSTEYSDFCAYHMLLSYKDVALYLAHGPKWNGYSVRCLKD